MFDLLKEGLEEAIDYHKGIVKLRTREVFLPDAPKKYQSGSVKTLRTKLGFTQQELAAWLNVSLNTVQAWEQGARNPSQSSLRLLEVLDKDFLSVEKILKTKSQRQQSKRHTYSSPISQKTSVAAKAKH